MYDDDFTAIHAAVDAGENDTFRHRLRDLAEKCLTAIDFTTGIAQPPLRIVRGGVHVDSASLGRWFRAIFDVERTFPEEVALRSVWERTYDELPTGVNTLSDRYVARSFYVVFGGTTRLPATPGLLHLLDSELSSMRSYLSTHDLFGILKRLKDLPAPTTALKGITKFRAPLTKWTKTWRDANAPGMHIPDEILIGFLYTWYPLLVRPSGAPVHLAVVAPYPPDRPPQRVSTLFTLFAYDVLPNPADLATLCDRVVSVFGPVISRLGAIDRDVLSQERPHVTLTVERAIRSLQHINFQSVEDEDHWHDWRKYFPLPGPDTEVIGTPEKRWYVPLWGASHEMTELFRRLERHLADDGKPSAKNKPGVKMVFLYSPPGCGKEIIARLCHYLSQRSQELEYVRSALARAKSRFPSKAHRRFLTSNLGYRSLSIESSTERAISYWANNACPAPWDFNYFVVQGGYLSSRNAAAELLGDMKARHLGLLTKASACGGTIFFDEINTLAPADANLFLRIAEKPHSIEVPGLAFSIGLDVLMIFASNKRPAELEQAGWNSAVLSRIAKPGSYFEIPPLCDRPLDIGVVTAYYLQKNAPQVRHLDVDALRWLCKLPWSVGNYRELGAVLDRLIDDAKRREAREITSEDVLQAYAGQRLTVV